MAALLLITFLLLCTCLCWSVFQCLFFAVHNGLICDLRRWHFDNSLSGGKISDQIGIFFAFGKREKVAGTRSVQYIYLL